MARELTVTAIALDDPRVTTPASYDGCASRSRPRTTGATISSTPSRSRPSRRRARTPEARYNRALVLVRLGRKDDEARAAVAEAPPESYRQAEARSLLDPLE